MAQRIRGTTVIAIGGGCLFVLDLWAGTTASLWQWHCARCFARWCAQRNTSSIVQSENDRPSLTTLPAWFKFVRCGWNARFRTRRDEDIEASLTGCTDRVTHPSGCSQLARLRSALIAIHGEPSAMAVNIFEAERSPTGSTTSACTPIFHCVTSSG